MSETTLYFDAPTMHFSWPTQSHADAHPEEPPNRPELGPPVSWSDGSGDQRNSTSQRAQQPHSYAPQRLYVDAANEQTNGHSPRHDERRTPSLQSLPETNRGRDKAGRLMSGSSAFAGTGAGFGRRKASVRTTRSASTNVTGAFTNGAALTGPNAEPDIDESIYERGASAERTLSQKDKVQILKGESKSHVYTFARLPTHSFFP